MYAHQPTAGFVAALAGVLAAAWPLLASAVPVTHATKIGSFDLCGTDMRPALAVLGVPDPMAHLPMSDPSHNASAVRITVRKVPDGAEVRVLPFPPELVWVFGYPYGHQEPFRPGDFARTYEVTQLHRLFDLASSAKPSRRVDFDIGPDVRWEDVLTLIAAAQRGGITWVRMTC